MRARARVSAPHPSTVLLAALPLALAAFALLLQVRSLKPRSGFAARVCRRPASVPTLSLPCTVFVTQFRSLHRAPDLHSARFEDDARFAAQLGHTRGTPRSAGRVRECCALVLLWITRLTLTLHRRANRDAGRVVPHVLGDRTGDAVPSLDWHAAAGQGVVALSQGRAGAAPSATGNASKVSPEPRDACTRVSKWAEMDDALSFQILITTTTGDPLRRIKQWYRYHATIGVRVCTRSA